MKKALLFLSALFVLSQSALAASSAQETKLKRLLAANPAVRGGIAEAKRFAGIRNCDPMEIQELTKSSFKVIVNCVRPPSGHGPAGDEALGQVEIEGNIYGTELNSESLFLEKIEFHYAG